MTNIKYQVHLFPGWCLVHGGRRNLWTQSSPLGLPMRLKGVIKEIIILIKWKSITTWKSDCEWLLTLVLHQMTRNSPKFVEVVGAVLITSGFLILGESIYITCLGASISNKLWDSCLQQMWLNLTPTIKYKVPKRARFKLFYCQTFTIYVSLCTAKQSIYRQFSLFN